MPFLDFELKGVLVKNGLRGEMSRQEDRSSETALMKFLYISVEKHSITGLRQSVFSKRRGGTAGLSEKTAVCLPSLGD